MMTDQALKTIDQEPLQNAVANKMQSSRLMQLVEQALTTGAGTEVITSLMDAQDRWDTREARRAFNEAMSNAMSEIPTIKKNKTVGFNKVSYQYEDLAEIAETVKPILNKYGLSYRFRTTQEGATVSVTCIVSHIDGYFEENTLSANNDTSGNKNGIQAVGSAVTYLERYTLKAALGLAAAEDDDAQSVSNSPVITNDQFAELNNLLDANEIEKAKFCAYMGVDAIANIPQSDFARAKKAIEKRIANKAGRANG